MGRPRIRSLKLMSLHGMGLQARSRLYCDISWVGLQFEGEPIE